MYTRGSNNNNPDPESSPSPPKSSCGDAASSNNDHCDIVPEDDPDVVEVDLATFRRERYREEPSTVNYVYTSNSTNTSVICDLGFRNLETVAALSPEELKDLEEKEFEQLSLSHNALRKIPHKFFSRFPTLRETLAVLDLSCNQLRFIPNDIDHFCNLTHLNLFLNKLRCLPPSLGQLTQLKWLNLAKNPDLFKSELLAQLAGPMLTDQQCYECAIKIKTWINEIMERRMRRFRNEIQASHRPSLRRIQHIGLEADEYLVRYYPDEANEDGSHSFINEVTSPEFDYDALNKQASRMQVLLGRLTKAWLMSILLTLALSVLVAPFVINESRRRDFTSASLHFIPTVLTEVAIAAGKVFHDLLWGVPCRLFLRDGCTYCNPEKLDLVDILLFRWPHWQPPPD